MIKRFFKYLDKLISGKFSKQVQVFFAVVVGFLGVFYVIASNVKHAGEFTEGGKLVTNVFWWVYIHFTYPGHLVIDAPEYSPKWLALIITLSGMIFFEGVFIGIIVHAIRERRDVIRRGLARYNFVDHYVIIGADEVIVSLVQELFKENRNAKKIPDIVILTKKDAEVVKEILTSSLPDEQVKKVYVLFGDMVKEEYKELALEKVKEIYIIGDDIYHGVNNGNIEIAYDIAQLVQEKKRIDCFINLPETTSLNLLKKFSFAKDVTDKLNLRPFNIYQGWSRLLWGSIDLLSDSSTAWFETKEEEKVTAPLANLIGSLDSDAYVHVVIIGFTEMGYALLEHTLEMAHFNTKKPTQIFVIGTNMQKNVNRFAAEFPNYKSIYDCNVSFLDADINDPVTRAMLSQWNADSNCRMVIFSCLNDPDAAFSAAALLPGEITKGTAPIFIYQQSGRGFFHLLGGDQDSLQQEFRNSKFFGWRREHSGLLKIREKLAEGIHEEYIAASKKNGRYNPDLPNFFKWNFLPEVFKWSNRYQADSFLLKLARSNRKVVKADKSKPVFKFESETISKEMQILARMEHDRWSAERIMAGWKYGAKAEKENKISDCLIPFDELDKTMQGYDYSAIKAMPDLLRTYCDLDIQ
jgi:hypothetical protein